MGIKKDSVLPEPVPVATTVFANEDIELNASS